MVLPLAGPVAAAMPSYEGMEFIVVGEQFVDLLKFHYQVTAGFRMAEYLAQQRALFRYVKELQDRSNYMTFKYMLDNMIYHGVLPRLSREQLSLLINHLADRDILVRGSATGIQPGTGISYAFNTFYLDSEHAITQALLNTDDDDGFVQLMTAIAMARATGQLPTKIAVANILGDEGVELADATAMIDAAVADSVIILARDRDGHEYLRPTE